MPRVGRDEVTGFDQHDVAGHETGRVDLLDAARPADPGLGDLELGQRLDAGQRLALLVRPHDHVERHQRRAR